LRELAAAARLSLQEVAAVYVARRLALRASRTAAADIVTAGLELLERNGFDESERMENNVARQAGNDSDEVGRSLVETASAPLVGAAFRPISFADVDAVLTRMQQARAEVVHDSGVVGVRELVPSFLMPPWLAQNTTEYAPDGVALNAIIA
jgi:hypothetical protein